MDNRAQDSEAKLIFPLLEPNVVKLITSFKPLATCSFSLDEIVDLSDIQNRDFEIQNDASFIFQIR